MFLSQDPSLMPKSPRVSFCLSGNELTLLIIIIILLLLNKLQCFFFVEILPKEANQRSVAKQTCCFESP